MNLVFIMADDLGWRDTSVYGSTFYETPNIDRLAERGMLFTQAYAANPLCSPTRSSVMTGLYPARIGITQAAGHLPEEVFRQSLRPPGPPWQRALQANSVTRLSLDYYTLAAALKDAGYATGHFGKWHLGREPYDPLHHGFNVDLPHWYGPSPGRYFAPWSYPDFPGQAGEHVEDRMAEEAVAFMRQHRDRPFFLNYWSFSVHGPWEAKPELVERFRAKAAQADPSDPQRHPVSAAMVYTLDEAVGRLTGALDELGLAEQTIVIFFSDNGGVTHIREVEGVPGVPVTSNLPLRGGKATLYEGGTREPLVVAWPGVTPPGSRSDEIVCSIDFYPTFLDMLGLQGKQPKAGQPFDGISFVPALEGRPLERDAIFCYFPHYTPATGNVPGTYVRRGGWKLIRFFADNADQTDRHELYHLDQDIGETNDLAAQRPDKVAELSALIDGFLRETGAVVPTPNPRYDPLATPSPP